MSATGSFIWYELMTSDATAAAKFYGAVVGWKIGDRSDSSGGDMDYRMIGRSDGGYNGGVLSLTAAMVQHGRVLRGWVICMSPTLMWQQKPSRPMAEDC